jgi:hypothetical protein
MQILFFLTSKFLPDFIIIITLFLFVYFNVLMCFLQSLPIILIWHYVVIVHIVIYFCFHCAASVIGLVAVDAAHK